RDALDNAALPIVYGGEARDTAHLITPDQASGKLVVLMVAGGFGGLRALRARAAPRIKGAAAMALVALDSLPSPSLGFLRRPQAFLDDVSTAQERPIPVLLIGRAAAARMFSTPLEQLTVGAAGGTADRPDSISNGADDDGSGSVAALEIAERIAALKQKPKRSILFVWHTAEEKGLLGSRYFTDHPTVPRDSIVAQFNMDMVGRGSADDETGR